MPAQQDWDASGAYALAAQPTSAALKQGSYVRNHWFLSTLKMPCIFNVP
jgi:hypothetical protein